jgi:hypothetical protein
MSLTASDVTEAAGPAAAPLLPSESLLQPQLMLPGLSPQPSGLASSSSSRPS